jgi:hypothetical protein
MVRVLDFPRRYRARRSLATSAAAVHWCNQDFTAFWPKNRGEDATWPEQPAIIRAKDVLAMTRPDFAVPLSLLCRQMMLLDKNDLLTWAIRGIAIE